MVEKYPKLCNPLIFVLSFTALSKERLFIYDKEK